jgi:REP element-mobilizing transposase RayT
MIRGIERKRIFQDDADRTDFTSRLAHILPETGTVCYAWALLPNHAHLLLRTGLAPLAAVMRRLLTGYAIRYNHRHCRHGQLFQNRYKSILCQEDTYLLELVRYIHLNPLRAKVVNDLSELDRYPYSGHSIVMGKEEGGWQDRDYVLRYFDRAVGAARRRYREYVEKGIGAGRRPELTGGGLIRSVGGWKKARELAGSGTRLKGDERILGDSDFVLHALDASNESFERRYRLKSQGLTLSGVSKRVSQVLGVAPECVYAPGKYAENVKARSLFCYWAVRELGISATSLARMLGLTQPAVSMSVKRGQAIAEENGFLLVHE